MATLASRLSDLITAIGLDMKSVDTRLDALEAGGGGGGLTHEQILIRNLGA